MPVTFGAVGDVISVCILTKDLVTCLDECRGSSAVYQAVIPELWSLEHALLEVEKLLRSCDQTAELNALAITTSGAVDQCKILVTGFQKRIEKHKNPLMVGSSAGRMTKTVSKIRWHVSEKEDLAKFRAEIRAHCSSVNTLLMIVNVSITQLMSERLRIGLETSTTAQAKTAASHASNLAKIEDRLAKLDDLIQSLTAECKTLSSSIDIDYFKKLGADVLVFMQRICNMNFMTYKAVLSLQNSLPVFLQRFWTQEPAILEDALGRVTPVHLEYLDCWEAFEAVLEIRFRDLPGHRKIKQREYVLRSKTMNKDIEQSMSFGRCFLPGQRIYMSMIFNAGSDTSTSCPGCKVVTVRSQEELDSQVQCPSCQIWYQRVTEIKSPSASDELGIPTQDQSTLQRRGRTLENDDYLQHFRRVRLRHTIEKKNVDDNSSHLSASKGPRHQQPFSGAVEFLASSMTIVLAGLQVSEAAKLQYRQFRDFQHSKTRLQAPNTKIGNSI